jgi:hemerythrin-like domain-containing protein
MDALELMKDDHDKIQQLFDQALANTDPGARARLLHNIRAELMAHEKMEEEIFLPALRAGGDKDKEIVLEGYVEHHVIDVILAELLEVPEEDEVWQAKLKVLKENLNQHIEEEEGEIFTRARQALGKQTLDDLGKKMAEMKVAARAL